MENLKGIGEGAHRARGIENEIDEIIVRADHDSAGVLAEFEHGVVEHALRAGRYVLVLECVRPADLHARLQG